MSGSLLFLLVFCVKYSEGKSLAQVFTISKQNIRIVEFFREVKRQTGNNIICNATIITESPLLDIEIGNAPLDKILQAVLHPQGLSFHKEGNNIIVVRADSRPVNNAVLTELGVQQPLIRGRITNSAGEVLAGVSISVKGKNVATASNDKGEFDIPAKVGEVLLFSSVGFVAKEVLVGSSSTLNVQLETEQEDLDEVVVIGYGTQKKVNVIGSVATVSDKELASAVVPNISNAMSGKMPGVFIQQRSGEPGANAASILIRGKSTLGNNSPLVVIDGVQGRDLNSVNVDDVESISVLKDAAAAIYGARAANGVILISTKSGKIDAAPVFNYRFYEGLQSPTKLPELANSWEYAEMLYEVESYRGTDPSNMTFTREDIEKFKSGDFLWTHPNTDWYKESLAKNTRIATHNFSILGGSNSIRYFTSLGSFQEEGIYRNSSNSFGRTNLKGRIDADINKYLSFGVDLNGVIERRKSSVKSSTNIFTSVIRSYPYRHAIFPGTDKAGPDVEYGDQPVITPSAEPGFDHQNHYRSNNILSMSLKVPYVEGLQLDAFYSYDKYFGKRKFFERPYTLHDFDKAGYLAAGNTGIENGEAFIIPYRAGTVAEPRLTDSYNDAVDKSLNIKLSYQKSFSDKHNVSGFLAYENAISEGQGISAFRRYFNSDQLPYLFAGGDAQKDNSGSVSNDSRVNFISRVNYDFEETYLMQVGFRRDGSVRFSKEKGRWGNFPSVLVGWRVSKYDWWKSSFSFIDELKLKASWAKMGNDLVLPYQYLSSYGFGTGGVFGEDAEYSPALYQLGTPNPFITWEVSNIMNWGLEAGLFNNSLKVDVDVFKERRSNILIKRNASVPKFTGMTLPDENYGIVENRGIEMTLGYNGDVSDFSYNIATSFSFARNKVIEFDEPTRSVSWQVATGKPMGSQLLYKAAGIFRDVDHVNSLPHVAGARPGDIIIEDFDKDGEITPDDRILNSLTADPEIMFSLNVGLAYKSFSLSLLIQGAENAVRNVYSFANQGTSGNYYRYDAIGRWTPENTNAEKPRAFDRVEEYWRQNYLTDYNFHKLSYARLKNVQLTYQLPIRVSQLLRIKHAEVNLSGQNLFLLYNKNKIFDPEVQNSQTYPLLSSFSIGGNFKF